jgi:hypothetical protein
MVWEFLTVGQVEEIALDESVLRLQEEYQD